jgi:hypothetical protein
MVALRFVLADSNQVTRKLSKLLRLFSTTSNSNCKLMGYQLSPMNNYMLS